MSSIPPTPIVLGEFPTMQYALQRRGSIARYGDGELRLASGRGSAKTQRERPITLVNELRNGLLKPQHALVCIPNFSAMCPKAENWKQYSQERRYAELYVQPCYGSAFISRPDNAPWINTFDYWHNFTKLWRDRNIILVRGNHEGNSFGLQNYQMTHAASIALVEGPGYEAYRAIDALEARIAENYDRMISRSAKRDAGPVLMCLGATATCLALRLAKRGVWVVDVGNVSKFIPDANTKRDALEGPREANIISTHVIS